MVEDNDDNDVAFASTYTPQSTKKSKQLYNLAIGIDNTVTKDKKNQYNSHTKRSSTKKKNSYIDVEDIELYNIYESNDNGLDPMNTTLEQLAFSSPTLKSLKPKRLSKLLNKLKFNKKKTQQFIPPVLEASKQEQQSPA